jgi:hypothetical protein
LLNRRGVFASFEINIKVKSMKIIKKEAEAKGIEKLFILQC